MIAAAIFILGLCFGSFALALADRLHARKDWVTDRSCCEYCNHVLGAADLVPLLSWLASRGRCRYCKHRLTWQYPAAEAGTGLAFLLSYIYWPEVLAGWQYLLFGVWLVTLVLFAVLLIYDLRYMLLPNGLVLLAIGGGLAWNSLQAVLSPDPLRHCLLTLGALVVSSGIFYALFQLSHEKWIGGGDVKLGVALGLLVGNPLNAAMVLFIASVLGMLFSLPMYLAKPAPTQAKKRAKAKKVVPFGPFLMLATFIVVLFGQRLLDWYTLRFLSF